MTQYIAIIRGINVGGHNKVNMKLLRETLEQNKFRNVQTYIQSGNIVFSSGISSIRTLETRFTKILKDTFDVNVPVIVRDEKEWKVTVQKNPFQKSTDDHTKLLVTFLSEKPKASVVKEVSTIQFPHDEFAIIGKDIYLYCKDGYGKTDIPNLFFEKKLSVTGTTRNWRTVMELDKRING